MRIFISYKFTGVPKSTLNNTVTILISILKRAGYEVFCNLERDDEYVHKKWSAKEIMTECFNELEKCDYHITFVAPNGKMGEGMLIELGYAKKMNLPTLLLFPRDYPSISAKAVVDKFIIYQNMSDLLSRIVPEIRGNSG